MVNYATFPGCVGANHYALVYEDVMEAAKLLCKYMNMDLIQ